MCQKEAPFKPKPAIRTPCDAQIEQNLKMSADRARHASKARRAGYADFRRFFLWVKNYKRNNATSFFRPSFFLSFSGLNCPSEALTCRFPA